MYFKLYKSKQNSKKNKAKSTDTTKQIRKGILDCRGLICLTGIKFDDTLHVNKIPIRSTFVFVVFVG